MLKPKGKIEFRIIHDSDEAFLERLYASTREWEFELAIWKDDEKDNFLKRQFKAQTQAYQQSYIGAVHRIIQLDTVDIGRLIIQRADDHMRIVDLSLLPEFRGGGIGTDILRSLLNEAHGGKVPVRLHAEHNSPALNLYLRHGFVKIGERGQYFALEWRPQTGPREI